MTILVTGASGGIGGAIAADLVGRGFTVGALRWRGTPPAGDGVVPLTADVTDEAAVSNAVLQLVHWAGPLRGVVNAAGVAIDVPSAEMTADQLRRVLDVNVVGAFNVCRAAWPHLKNSGGGLVVNVGSFYDRLGVRDSLAYTASKAALASLGRCLAVEWAHDGIRVVTVAPGYVPTALNAWFFADPERRARMERRIPVGRLGRPEEVGRLVGMLFAEDVPFLTGTTIYVDGGQGISL